MRTRTLLFSSGIKDKKVVNTDNTITNWLEERQALIKEFFTLFEMHPMPENPVTDRALVRATATKATNTKNIDHTNLKKRLEKFNDILVDYVSVGHFEVFEKIYAAQKIYGEQVINYRNSLVKQILDTTNKVLEFEEKYNKPAIFDNITNPSQQGARSEYTATRSTTVAFANSKMNAEKSVGAVNESFEQTLKKDVSELMLLLEKRFELEDVLIKLYKKAVILEHKLKPLVGEAKHESKHEAKHAMKYESKNVGENIELPKGPKPKPRIH